MSHVQGKGNISILGKVCLQLQNSNFNQYCNLHVEEGQKKQSELHRNIISNSKQYISKLCHLMFCFCSELFHFSSNHYNILKLICFYFE